MRNPLYKGYKHKPEAIKRVRAIIKDGYYKKNERGQLNMLTQLLNEICDIYGVTPPNVSYGTQHFGAFGSYNPGTQTINLSNTSIVTALHELRHHFQHTEGFGREGYNSEQDAHGWSIGLFAKAVPKMFEKAVKGGKIAALVWDEERGAVNNPHYPQIQ